MDPRAGRTRQAVLAAGRELLVEGGLDAVTHLQAAARAGVGRRSVYRHWPGRDDLLHDVLSSTSAPTWRPTDDLAADVLAHLTELRSALVHGPLALVTAALAERSAVDPGFRPLRERLSRAGCAPLARRLAAAVEEDDLPAGTDVDALLAQLEGPVFYEVMVRGVEPTDAMLVHLLGVLATAAPGTDRAAGQGTSR